MVVPDFEALVPRASQNLGAVWRVNDGRDWTAVRVGLLSLELQRGCVGSDTQSGLTHSGSL